MNSEVEAWILDRGEFGERGRLRLGSFPLRERGPGDVLAEPLFGSWEANMDHALSRVPVDVCALRGEASVVLGNGGLVRVLETGSEVNTVREGELAIVFGNDVWDDEGYMIKALAYDSPGSMGVLAKRLVLKSQCLIPIPPDSTHTPEEWAAFSLRYSTAWANWRVAHGAWRLQHAGPDAELFVFGWGGGTTFAELTLALHHGAHCFQFATSERRQRALEQAGIHPIDRGPFTQLAYDPARYAGDEDYRAAYRTTEKAFLELVHELTGGRGVSIFVDYIGAPVYRATLKALGREGVITSAGWKRGMDVSYNRAIECTRRTLQVNTHFARYQEGLDAVRFAEEHGWLPPTPLEVHDWERVPELAESYLAGRTGYFPIFRVNS